MKGYIHQCKNVVKTITMNVFYFSYSLICFYVSVVAVNAILSLYNHITNVEVWTRSSDTH